MLIDILREIFFPRKCIECDARDTSNVICDACFIKIPVNRSLFCGQCQARLPDNKKICHQSIPYLLGAAGNYDYPILQKLIHALKFKRNREAAIPLGLLLALYVKRISLDLAGFTVIAMPLSKRRDRERGFNQSKLIAQFFATYTNLPIISNLLLRIRHTTPQSLAKDIRERRRNVHDAFAVYDHQKQGAILFTKNPLCVPQNIILIDDVTTSGATLLEAATALKSAGARTIVALTTAKA